jgi:hypothetical protein
MSMTQVGTAMTTGGDGAALDPASLAELSQAMGRLQDGGGLVVRLADVVGGAMGRGVRFGTRSLGIVPGAQAAVQSVVEVALKRRVNSSRAGASLGRWCSCRGPWAASSVWAGSCRMPRSPA